ncbi:AIPR family protein [Paracoccus spongiarum]|uniref:AIPR family protein n=1 Tax=Paracoccus spongiarum TaxID=3064387 RepID=A0ABT9JG53_9RHOB|nr:AIPR family protein [Paracoccus sp. 2205BS29-5]MDP5308788.1 AIPR family protein [Paracoccus sp. 2205BS29-5]
MTTADAAATLFAFPYHNCRNISSPEDSSANRKVYAGTAPARSVLELEDNENVREYLVEAKGKQKKTPTLVHQAIRKTLKDNSPLFSILNGGIVIVARDAEVDDKNKKMTLLKPSIINGSQTQGELRRFYNETFNEDYQEPSIRYEIIVTDDDDLIAEISIARNFQNDVRALSIAGRRGHIDALEARMIEHFPDVRLQKSESEQNDKEGTLDTEKLVQVTFAALPVEMMEKFKRQSDPENKVFSYSQKTRCLKLFQELVEKPENKEVYDCFLDVAPIAWKLYLDWKQHQGFIGTGIRSIEREDRKVKEVPDGLIFPIIAAHSVFIRHNRLRWKMERPEVLTDADLIRTATQAYQEIANHNPQTMGKTKGCYSLLMSVTSIYARLTLQQ